MNGTTGVDGAFWIGLLRPIAMTRVPFANMLRIMPIHASHFGPFLSLGLIRARSSRRSVDTLLREIQAELFSQRPSSELGKPSGVKKIENFTESSIEGRGFVYRVQETPSWWQGPSDSTPADKEWQSPMLSEIHHLVLLLKMDRLFAIYTSHASDWVRIRRGIHGGRISRVEPVPAELLNGAFTNNNWAMGAVWMKGLHNSVETKADSKQLTGLNVRSAIDPFGDQTYHFSSGRSKVPKGDVHETLGLSPGKHRIWLGQATDFSDFCKRAAWAMGLLSRATELASPIAELALPLSSLDDLEIPDELSWAPQGERESWSPETVEAVNLLEGMSIDIDTTGSKIEEVGGDRRLEVVVMIIEQAAPIAEVTLEIRYVCTSNSVAFDVKRTGSPDMPPIWEAAIETVLIGEGWGKLRYSNGCVVSGGVAYLPHYSAKPFTGWTWVDFNAFGSVDLTKEKPIIDGETDKRKVDLDRIGGDDDDSLFTWIHKHWGRDRQGILLCDDGSGEIADFLHLAPRDEDGVSALALIHAKASKSAKMSRGLSVGEYEIVVSQAVKNLAYASPAAIAGKLRDLSGKARVWVNGDRQEGASYFADQLEDRGRNMRLRIVVLQPHTLKSRYEIDPSKAPASLKGRHAQLSTLLLEAEAACRSIGATFSVVASER